MTSTLSSCVILLGATLSTQPYEQLRITTADFQQTTEQIGIFGYGSQTTSSHLYNPTTQTASAFSALQELHNILLRMTNIITLRLVLAAIVLLYTDAFGLTPILGSGRISTHLSVSSDENSSKTEQFRFLGKGDRALVRPGVVLVAPNHEYNHFLMRSAVFIHATGLNEYNEHVTRGVIIDHPTAFSMAEMGGGSVYGTLAHNVLYRGGDVGNDSAMLLHAYGHNDENEDATVDCGDMIGTSGIYEGGLYDAMDLVDEDLVDPELFKFFFNYVEFSDVELETMLSAVDSDGDAWSSMEIPPKMILNSDFDRGECWTILRNKMRKRIFD